MADKPHYTSDLLPDTRSHVNTAAIPVVRMDSRCVYLTWSCICLQKLRLRRLVIGLKQQDFHSMLSSMKVTHRWSCFLVFMISFSHPLSLHPHILYCAVYFRASALVQGDGSWERPVCRCWDLCYFSLHFSTFSPPTLSTVSPLPFQHSPHPFPAWFEHLCTFKDSNLKRRWRRWRTPTSSVSFLILLVENAFNNL